MALTKEDRDEEHARDRERAPENRRVLEGPNLAQLATGSLNRGPSINIDVRTPKERGGKYQWSARDVSLPYEEIRTRWTPEVLAVFEQRASGTMLTGGGSLLDHLTGVQPAARPAVTVTGLARPATFAEALARAGLSDKAAWSRADCANLRSSLRVQNPVQAADLISGITGARSTGVLTTREIIRTVQDLLDILPPEIARSLPKLGIELIRRFTKNAAADPTVLGDYSGAKNGPPRVRVSVAALKGIKGESRRREMRRILSHELMHWLHTDATHRDADRYRAVIRAHYGNRTAADAVETIKGVSFRRDKWHDPLAGIEYKWENGRPSGVEVPSRHFELWETPEALMFWIDQNKHPNAGSVRETFALVHSIFNQPQTLRKP